MHEIEVRMKVNDRIHHLAYQSQGLKFAQMSVIADIRIQLKIMESNGQTYRSIGRKFQLELIVHCVRVTPFQLHNIRMICSSQDRSFVMESIRFVCVDVKFVQNLESEYFSVLDPSYLVNDGGLTARYDNLRSITVRSDHSNDFILLLDSFGDNPLEGTLNCTPRVRDDVRGELVG